MCLTISHLRKRFLLKKKKYARPHERSHQRVLMHRNAEAYREKDAPKRAAFQYSRILPLSPRTDPRCIIKCRSFRAGRFLMYQDLRDLFIYEGIIHIDRRGASTGRVDARIGSAHARNYRGCSIGISGSYMRQYCQGVH